MLTIQLARGALLLDPVVVTARRIEEELLEVPVAVSVVQPERLEQQRALTTIEYLSVLPEAQVLSGGLMTRRYTTRGPNFGNSATVRTMTDFRYTTMPGIVSNADYLVSTTVEDIARAELVRGQATVQYGPNSSRGALNLITRSPLDDRGTTVAVTGGERSAVQATFRHATVISEKVGVKLSGEYFQGRDWLPPDIDPQATIDGKRLDDSERIRADARIDWRPDDKTSAMFNAGVGQGMVFDAVTFGGNRAYISKGRQWYLQGRVTRGKLSANVFYNQLDLDGSFTDLSVPAPIRESSYNFWAQLQHGTQVGSRTSLQYGADLGRTVPRSDSTLYGAWEGQADLTELGTFLSATARLSPKFELMLAGRADYNSQIGNTAFSPWATVIYYPQPSHAIRFGASRSFTPPTPIGSYGDFIVAQFGPYALRFTGTGPGRTFRRDCAGLCMRSPFNPASAGGASEYLPADATTQWAAAVALLQSQGIDISAIPAPDGTQVASVLATLNSQTGSFDPTTASDVIDVPGIEGNGDQRRWINQLEVGYRGLINNRIRVGADVYYRENSHIASQRGEPFEAELTDVFALQGDVAEQVALAMNVTLLSSEELTIRDAPTNNPAAYQEYVLGRYYQARTDGNRAIEHFQNAIELDPDFALAYAGLAHGYHYLNSAFHSGGGGFREKMDNWARAEQAARRAIALDSTLGAAHIALGYVEMYSDLSWEVAEARYRRGLALNPNYAEGHSRLSLLLVATGRVEESLAEARRAIELDPLSPLYRSNLTGSLLSAGQAQEALAQADSVLALDSLHRAMHFAKSGAYLLLEDWEGAADEMGRLGVLSDEGVHLWHEALLDPEKSPAFVAYLDGIQPIIERFPTVIGVTLTAVGEYDRAIEVLELAYYDRAIFALQYLKTARLLDPLRAHPEFISLLRRMRLE